MSGDSFLRRSLRRSKKKKKDGGGETAVRIQSSTNFGLALGETERLSAENRKLKQELEYERSRNNYNGNDFRFPPSPVAVSTEQQTDADETRQRNPELERENEDLKKKIQDLEGRIRQNHRLHCIEEQLLSIKNQMESSFNQREITVLKNINILQKQCDVIQKELHKFVLSPSLTASLSKLKLGKGQEYASEGRQDHAPVGKEGCVDTYEDLKAIKDLILSCNREQREQLERMEETLAKEMKSNSFKKQFAFDTIPDNPEVMKMPQDVTDFGWKLQSYMVETNKVKHFFRALGVNSLDIERLTSKPGTPPRDQFWSMLCFWYRQHSPSDHLDELHQACESADLGILRNGLMPKKHRQIIEKCYSYLEDNLMPAVTLPFLRDYGLLDDSDIFHVTSPDTRRHRCACLLNLLPLFGKHALDTFCDALVRSEQGHVAESIREQQKLFGEDTVDDSDDADVFHKGYCIKPQSQKSELASCFQGDMSGSDGHHKDILLQILATLLTSSRHMEAMMMNMSATDDRSERCYSCSTCPSLTRSGQYCPGDPGSNTSTLA